MKSILFALAMILIFGQPALASSEWNGDYIIKLTDTRDFETQLDSLEMEGFRIDWTIPELNLAVGRASRRWVERARETMRDLITYISLNRKVRSQHLNPEEIEDPVLKNLLESERDHNEAESLWGMVAINAPAAWEYTTGVESVVMAVSDTGIWYRHFDLKDSMWTNPGETGFDENGVDLSKNGIDDDGNGVIDDVYGANYETGNGEPRDIHYHGTHVAGTMGATKNGAWIAGVAGNARLMALKFLGSDGSGTDAGGAATIVYGAQMGAKVVNCSWGGGTRSRPIEEAIEFAKERDVLIVAAAGNSGVDADKQPLYPAAFEHENVISVGATLGKRHEIAWFSNRGKISVDLAAPGHSIYSTVSPMGQIHGRRGYRFYTLSGTSMASPHVAGVVGLIYSINPDLNWKQVKAMILSTVFPVKDWEGKTVTGGILDAHAAVMKAMETLEK